MVPTCGASEAQTAGGDSELQPVPDADWRQPRETIGTRQNVQSGGENDWGRFFLHMHGTTEHDDRAAKR